ncbi:MAG TPA: Arc family DNA-binding protein [Ktedonobacterales bacterium]|nr:Arc family DNA-binding protein [Ktedonobacterales bacterium]
MEDTSKGEQRISIRFPLDVLAAIRALAKQHERSFNGEIIWALREYARHHSGELGEQQEQGKS